MNFRTLLALSCLAPVVVPASALTVTVEGQIKVTGPVQVGGAAWLPGGFRAVCLGNRLLVLDGSNHINRLMSTGESVCEKLSVNPSGTLAVTLAGNSVNVWRLSDGVRVVQRATGPLSGSGFVSDSDLLLAGPAGLDRLNVLTGVRQTVQNTPVNSLFVAPDGQRAVIGTVVAGRGRVQLISTYTLKALSGTQCDALCVPQNAQFGASGRSVAVRTGSVLLTLREGFPSSTVLRGLTTTEPASGLPLPDASVLTFVDGNAESRDLQTGRREGVLPIQGVLPEAVSLSVLGRVSALTASGDLLNADLAFRDVQRLALPAALMGGGEGAVLLPSGELRAGPKTVAGGFASVQAMNKSTWTLGVLSEEKQEVGLLSGGAVSGGTVSGSTVRVLTSVAAAEGAEARLSVNHWGNHALTWSAAGVTAVAQASGKVVATLKPSALNLAPAVLAASTLTLSPDAARVFVLPAAANAAPFVYTLATRQRAPLSVLPLSANQSYASLQISGKGVLALGSVTQTSEPSPAEVGLYRPGEARPYATVKANPDATRQNLHRFSPDSTLLAVVNADERGFRIDLIDTATGKVAATTPPLANAPAFLSWSPDNARLSVGAGLLDALNAVTVFGVKP
ncbi:MAG: hypothetical protein JWQ08_487 [Deinococcus sp.]|nr:hypothetical protein [Deinococcus sp.]